MRVLTKDFSWLGMRFNIQYGMVMESIAFFFTTLSSNVVSAFEISAINLIGGLYEFACSMNRSISCKLLVSHSGKISSM